MAIEKKICFSDLNRTSRPFSFTHLAPSIDLQTDCVADVSNGRHQNAVSTRHSAGPEYFFKYNSFQ